MWPTDHASEVSLRQTRLRLSASPRRPSGSDRWRRGFGVRLIRLGVVVAGPKAFDRPFGTAVYR
jgi:hypothetical protein